MIDIDFIKLKLFKQEESRKIQEGDRITEEVVNLLKQGAMSDIKLCFASSNGGVYYIDVSCDSCKKIMLKELSKTKTLEYLQEKQKYYCDICLSKIYEQRRKEKEENEKKAEEREIKRKETILKNTEWYIEQYINPEHIWKDEFSAKNRYNHIIHIGYEIDDDIVAQHINNMDYQDFLNTPYWIAISQYAKYRNSYSCQLCSSKENLRTHHKTYKNHGYEHNINVIKQDLIVLCEKCHKKFHEIEE